MKSSMEPAGKSLWQDPEEPRRKKDRPEKKVQRKLLSDAAEDTSAGIAVKPRKSKGSLSEDDDWDEDDMLTILEYRRKGFIKSPPEEESGP